MKMKLFAILAMLAVAAGTQAADVSVNDITIGPGTASVEVPVLISPSDPNETIGAMNISFAAGAAADAIPILGSGTEFDGSIWDMASSFFGAAGTPSVHSVLSAVTAIMPLQLPTDGTLITYTLDTSSLPGGTYELNPNFQVMGVGSSGDPNINGTPTDLSFTSGSLVVIPEPSTMAMTGVLAFLGLGVFIKRRRG